MIHTIYLEEVLVINFVVDLALMALTGRIMGERPRRLGYCLAALLMSVGACTVFLPWMANRFVLTVVMVGGAAGIAWKWRSWKQWARNAAALLSISALAGGLAFFGAATAQNNPALLRIGLQPGYVAALAVAACAGLGQWAFGRLSTRSVKAWQCTVRIRVDGCVIELDALVDTGNQLSDPISGLPVIILGQDQSALLHDKPLVRIGCKTAAGIGELPAFLPDGIDVCTGGVWRPGMHAYAAISEQNRFAGKQAIVPACILEN